jgi:hypothetical protein
MPLGELVTVPVPVPAFVTVSVTGGMVLNVAVTAVCAFMVTVQLPVPVQAPPDHPAKVDPAAGVAVRATTTPLAKLAVQAEGQLIPDGELTTVPDPEPVTVAVRL